MVTILVSCSLSKYYIFYSENFVLVSFPPFMRTHLKSKSKFKNKIKILKITHFTSQNFSWRFQNDI